MLCGALSDIKGAKKFKRHFKYEYVDLVGRTSIVDLLYVIYKGNLVIANETSAAHLTVALEMTSVLIISNGNHYGRFTPYPKDMTNKYHVIYHPQIEKDLDNYKKLSNSYGYGSKLNINEISVESVMKKIDEVLNEIK